MKEEKKLVVAMNSVVVGQDTVNIQNLIYTVRNQQVMIDSDLAILYNVETSHLNRAVKRNCNRFPEDFCFQLSVEEYRNLKCQIGISSFDHSGYGGRRTRPYAFTEQGISMLASVLHSDTAVNASINIMRAFVEMRHFISNHAQMFERISQVELRQMDYEHRTDERIDRIFEYISDHEESAQKVFFDGQIYDAFSLITGLIQKAVSDIILIDGYVDTSTLDLLSKKQSGVAVAIYTFKKNSRLTNTDIAAFNSQYPSLNVNYMTNYHDRFLILDHMVGYHIGASIKDAGKKCFAITMLEDPQTVQDILGHL